MDLDLYIGVCGRMNVFGGWRGGEGFGEDGIGRGLRGKGERCK